MAVYRYEIPTDKGFPVAVEMPEGSELLALFNRHDKPMIWARVNTQRPTVKRRFILVGIGQPIEDETVQQLEYVGTDVFWMDCSLHLFEVNAPLFCMAKHNTVPDDAR